MSKSLQSQDTKFMRLAIQEAKKGTGRVFPNPLVGCLIVKDNKILARGYHHHYGADHAEVDALKKINFKAQGATLYVTLEPCFHKGKTPPCVKAVIRSGVTRVVIACEDVDVRTKGKSIEFLKKMGCAVTCKVLEKEAWEMNRAFWWWHIHQRPYLIVKQAQSKNGYVSAKNKRTKISGAIANRYVHHLRSQVDAILVGESTLKIDNPLLNVRHIKSDWQPRVVILSPSLDIDFDALQIFNNPSRIIIATALKKNKTKDSVKLKQCQRLGITVLAGVKTNNGQLDLDDVFTKLAKFDIRRILVEPGQKLGNSLYDRRELVGEWQWIISPKTLEKGIKGLSPSKIKVKTTEIIKKGRDEVIIKRSPLRK